MCNLVSEFVGGRLEMLAKRDESAEQRRIAARREIERRNELKALNSELDEGDELFDDEDL